MGGCVAGRENNEVDTRDALLSKASPSPSASTARWPCVAQIKDKEGGPFCYRVIFRSRGHLDLRGDAIKSVTEALWLDAGIASPSLIDHCCETLQEMSVRQRDALYDFVVPIINVTLHAQNAEVRARLWRFVLGLIHSDSVFAHLCYWACNAVATCPLALAETRTAAQQKRGEIARLISGSESGSTPLVDLLHRLHDIGVEIVKVTDKEQRLATLRCLIQKRVNEGNLGSKGVPILILAPHAAPRGGWPAARIGDPLPAASVLQLPTEQARVLSSKERAPYLVLLEVETSAPGRRAQDRNGRHMARGGALRRLFCPCRRQPEVADVLSNGNGLSRSPNRHTPGQCQITDYVHAQNKRPRGIFNTETWEEVVDRIRGESEYSSRPNWCMISMIVKSNADDVRQEELACRLIKWFSHVFERHQFKHWLQPFLIIATCHDGGCLETVTNAISLHELKKTYGPNWQSLKAYFDQAYHLDPNGETTCRSTAIRNFIYSMAGYSVVCYVLAIRDRHNGNILIDDDGHIIHVDFGFMLCGAPGGKALQKMGGFELSSGFKLTSELVEVFGPLEHEPFKLFRQMVTEGMLAVRDHAEELLALLQLSMLGSENDQQRCFLHPIGYKEAVLEDVCERLGLTLSPLGDGKPSGKTREEFVSFVDKMIDDSVDHWRSRYYDKYQYHFTGIH